MLGFGRIRDQVTDSTASVKETADAVTLAMVAVAIVAGMALLVATVAYRAAVARG